MERLTYPSTWRCSEEIRLLAYKILSASNLQPISSIREYDRRNKKLVYYDIKVPTEDLTSYSLHQLYQRSEEERLVMFYSSLGLTDDHVEQGVVCSGRESRRDNDILTALAIHWVNKANPCVSNKYVMGSTNMCKFQCNGLLAVVSYF